jgi:hypothetical protein
MYRHRPPQIKTDGIYLQENIKKVCKKLSIEYVKNSYLPCKKCFPVQGDKECIKCLLGGSKL